MSRNRLTWKDRKSSEKKKPSRKRRRKRRTRRDRKAQVGQGQEGPADLYDMNVQNEDHPAREYTSGDPSSWAAVPHKDMPDDPALGRNEIGLTNMPDWAYDHKDADEWNSDQPYDNADTFNQGDRRATANRSRRDVMAHLEKKASHCIRIAKSLIPGASEAELEEQALDLMEMPDRAVVSTSSRLADHQEDSSSEDGILSDDEILSMLKEMKEEEEEKLKEKEEEEEAEAEDEEEDESFDEDELQAAIRDVLSEDDEDEEEKEDDGDLPEELKEKMKEKKDEGDDEDEEEDEEEDEVDEEEIEAMLSSMMEEESSASDAQVETMVEELNTGSEEQTAELDVELSEGGGMDVGSNPQKEALDEDTRVLQRVFEEDLPEGARGENPQDLSPADLNKVKGANDEGVSTLGGQVKQSSSEDEGLESLWEKAPDVDDVF